MSQIVLRFLVNVFVICVASRFFRGIQLAAPGRRFGPDWL